MNSPSCSGSNVFLEASVRTKLAKKNLPNYPYHFRVRAECMHQKFCTNANNLAFRVKNINKLEKVACIDAVNLIG